MASRQCEIVFAGRGHRLDHRYAAQAGNGEPSEQAEVGFRDEGSRADDSPICEGDEMTYVAIYCATQAEGFGESGYDVTELVGVEVLPKDATR